MRLGLYPANVDSCASDGSTCDVTPADKRISAEKNVKVRVGIPSTVAVVSPGATVLLGWERGDPGSPYCMPGWGIGATVTKLQLNAQAIEIGGNSFSDLKTETLLTDLSALLTFLNTWVPLVVTAVATAPSGVAADPGIVTKATAMISSIASGSYKSTVVKHG